MPRNIVTTVVNNAKELCNFILVYIESILKNLNVAEDILNTACVISNEKNSIFEMFETEYKISKVIKKNKSYIECSFFVVREKSVVNKKKIG